MNFRLFAVAMLAIPAACTTFDRAALSETDTETDTGADETATTTDDGWPPEDCWDTPCPYRDGVTSIAVTDDGRVFVGHFQEYAWNGSGTGLNCYGRTVMLGLDGEVLAAPPAGIGRCNALLRISEDGVLLEAAGNRVRELRADRVPARHWDGPQDTHALEGDTRARLYQLGFDEDEAPLTIHRFLAPTSQLVMLPDTNSAVDLQPTQDGVLVAAAGAHDVVKVHGDGSIAWTADHPLLESAQAIAGTAGEFFVLGSDRIVRLDGNGQWLDAEGIAGEWRAITDVTGGVCALGGAGLQCFDADGTPRWSYTPRHVTSWFGAHDYSPAILERHPDGGFVYAWGVHIHRVSEDGLPLWDTPLPTIQEGRY